MFNFMSHVEAEKLRASQRALSAERRRKRQLEGVAVSAAMHGVKVETGHYPLHQDPTHFLANTENVALLADAERILWIHSKDELSGRGHGVDKKTHTTVQSIMADAEDRSSIPHLEHHTGKSAQEIRRNKEIVAAKHKRLKQLVDAHQSAHPDTHHTPEHLQRGQEIAALHAELHTGGHDCHHEQPLH